MTKTIPAEYLRLRLDQVLIAAGTPAPKRGEVELAVVLAAVRTLAAQIAERDAKQRREERAWARKQLARLTTALPTSLSKPARARRSSKPAR